MQDVLYWIWLNHVLGPGSLMSDILLDAFSYNAHDIYEAGEDDYHNIKGIDGVVDRLMRKDMTEPKNIYEWCLRSGVGFIVPTDLVYTQRLRSIPQKPLILYYVGQLRDLSRMLCIACVGTRHMTQYGQDSAHSIVYELARCGAVIVSGMAAGIDGVCHNACLEAGGYTVAVLGCGIDICYPSIHINLRERIASQGMVITEFKPGTRPLGMNFPVRNRIISGLSQGTVVVEGDSRSGALITARYALSHGRDLFAVPGKMGEMTSAGPNELIHNGARMVTGAHDIILEYSELYPEQIDIMKLSKLRPRFTVRPSERNRQTSVTKRDKAGVNTNTINRSLVAAPAPESPSAPDPRGQGEIIIKPGKDEPDPDINNLNNPAGTEPATKFEFQNQGYSPDVRNAKPGNEPINKSSVQRRQKDDIKPDNKSESPINESTFNTITSFADAVKSDPIYDDLMKLGLNERKLLEMYKRNDVHSIDNIIIEIGDHSGAMGAVTMLEIRGYITHSPGGGFQLNTKTITYSQLKAMPSLIE